MSDKFVDYHDARTPPLGRQVILPLYGAGFENLGELVEGPVPACGPDELLVRHDACGICFSDINKKAFLVTRVGDVMFMVGLFILFNEFGSLNYTTMFNAETLSEVDQSWLTSG